MDGRLWRTERRDEGDGIGMDVSWWNVWLGRRGVWAGLGLGFYKVVVGVVVVGVVDCLSVYLCTKDRESFRRMDSLGMLLIHCLSEMVPVADGFFLML